MAIINSYGIWNNKGGVGKSTITFHLAVRYAELNPNINVLVIDLCPQANSSMMLLGGGIKGEGNVIKQCTEPIPKTVVGYISTIIGKGAGAPLPNPHDFIIETNQANKNMPKNLYLLCGDGNLEPISPAINSAAITASLLPNIQPWVWVHNIFRDFISKFADDTKDKDLMIFVDTNPSFGIYTELAITAVNRLICPVNADDSSRTASNAMIILLHGTNPPHPIYGSWTFAAAAQKYKTNIPKIHLAVGNRLTQYGGAATAFSALSNATAKALYDIYINNPNYFTNRQTPINSIKDFRKNYSIPLRDFNTSGVVAAHLGQRLNQMESRYYKVHGQKVQINKNRVKECIDAIDIIIKKLEI